MTTTETQTATRARSISGGIGTLAMAAGLLVVFLGYANQATWAIGMGSFITGVGTFIALVAASVYFFSKR